MNSQELADDVIATIDSLVELSGEKESKDPDDMGPLEMMGFDPRDLIEQFKPQIRVKVVDSPDKALQAMALANRASEDILDKYADRSAEELAQEAIENERE